ncbi:MAG: DUF2281 domain-containing protein [Hormoscilla sp. GM102CHS1]|nr:DUF2281 domain-containing protein [Hormoscilla sp. GM102CHS1]
MTIQPAILEKLESLPESIQLKVLQYIDSLIENREQYMAKGHPAANQPTEQETAPKKDRVAGTMKGMIIMSDDFDEPLEDLKDYM